MNQKSNKEEHFEHYMIETSNNLTRYTYAIGIYRYLFAFIICILHIKEYYGDNYPFGGGYLAVEFFLVLSGYLMMKECANNCSGGGVSSATILQKAF